MAEAKRRSEVKPFAHRTIYPQPQQSTQPSLFEDALAQTERYPLMLLDGATAPVAGTQIYIRIESNEKVDIICGSQIIAVAPTSLQSILHETLAMKNRQQGYLKATVVEIDNSTKEFTLKVENTV